MAKYTVLDEQTGNKITFQWDGESQPTDSDMQEIFSQAKQMKPAVQQQTPQPEQTSGLRSLAAKAAPYARPALEMGGALAGGVLAAPGNVLAPGLASVAGAGLGYAAGHQAADALDEYAGRKESATLPQALASTAMAVPRGAAMEMGGALVGLPVQAGMKAVGKAAPKIYESVLKGIPKSIPKFKRDKALTTALEEGIAPTQKGILKLKDKIDVVGERIGSIVRKAEKAGDKIKTKDIIKNLDEIEKEFSQSDLSDIKLLKLSKYKERLLKNVGKDITPREALNMKKSINGEISKMAYKVDPRLTEVAKMRKNIVEGITDNLVKKYPQLGSENITYSNLKALEEVIEKTAEKNQSALMTLGDIGASGVGGVVGGRRGAVVATFVNKLLNTPGFVSQFSFMLNKASKVAGIPTASRVISYNIFRNTPESQKKLEESIAEGISNLDMASSADAAETAEASPMNEIVQPDAKNSTPAASAMQEGYRQYHAGEYDAAIKAFKKAIKDDPSRSRQFMIAINMILKEKKNIKKYEKAGI